jgi:DNA-directed RNA polymerase subunit K
MEKTVEQFTKYERARILGARSLQISMDAPLLVKVDDDALSNLNFDPLRIAALELDSGVLPISVKRPLPEKKEVKLETIKVEAPAIDDKDKQKVEKSEEKRVYEEGEIMELVNPEDEAELDEAGEDSSESE